MLIFLNHIMDEICIQAENNYPLECCGILLGGRDQRGRIVCKTVPMRNIAGETQSHTHYRIDPMEFVRVEKLAVKAGLEIVGFYHSHPDYDDSISKEDVSYMIAGYSYPIISVKKGTYAAISSYQRKSQADGSVCREEIIIE